MISPQLRALGFEIRLLAVFLDAIAAYGRYCIEVQGRVDTAVLVEGREEGWNEDRAARLMAERGWKGAEGIYDAAQIPEKHRRVMDLSLWRDHRPGKKRSGYFTVKEISDLTGHPIRTVELWLHDDRLKLDRLGADDYLREIAG